MRLFLKLFFSFLLVLLLTVGLVAWGTFQLRGDLDEIIRLEKKRLETDRRQLAEEIKTTGVKTIEKKLREHPRRARLFILDARGEELLHRPPPPDLQSLAERIRRRGAERVVGRIGFKDPAWSRSPWVPAAIRQGFAETAWALPARGPNGKLFFVFADRPEIAWIPELLARYPMLLLFTLLSSALAVLLLARHFTAPIQRLRNAALELATGELTSRAPLPGRRLPDELTDLSRDFNYMAERLENLFHAQTRLLREVSHELRSPLARMRAALGLMERDNPQPGDHQRRLELELDRLDRLIGRLITLSRPSADGAIHRDQWLDLGALAKTVVDDARFEAGPEPGRIHLETTEPILIRANGEMIHSALENVLRNALRHSPADRPVQVSVRALAEEAIITVSDQGPGVPEKQLPHLFEPFFRVNDQRQDDSGGFGLGLAIAARAIHDHDGTIHANNRPGGGLEVTLRLPLEPLPPEMDDPSGEAPELKPPTREKRS